MRTTSNVREVELPTLNLALLRRQPKLCEDPVSLSFHLIFCITFIFVYFLFLDPRYVYVFVLVCFSYRFNGETR